MPHDAIRPFAGRAAREHVSLADTHRTDWFVAIEHSTVIGVAGLIASGAGLRIKGVWIEPAHRARGVGTALTQHLVQLAQERCAAFVEALAWHPEFYEARGFTRIGVTPHGAAKMRRLL